MKTLLILFAFFALPALSSELSIQIKKASGHEKTALLLAFQKVSDLLPENFKAGLPGDIQLKVEKLSEHQSIPADICENKIDKTKKAFIYGEYNHRTKTLTLNQAVVNVLVKGPEETTAITCQHKTLYDQALSTIVHELAHAFDNNGHNISTSVDFLQKAGFKKSLLKIKNRNTEAMRPADPYELQNSVEAFAVNAEYFVMDSEFSCRRPAMFDYLKSVLGTGKMADGKCQLNRSVMMSTSAGFYPVKLDPSRVYRIDYLLAAPGKEISSGFGHSMFRIVLCAPEHYDPITNQLIPATPFGKKCLEDKLYHLVVSYRANVEDATLNYMKGLFGGYPSMLFILNFGDVLDEYNRDELRDVISYPLNLNAKEKTDILNKVLEDHWNYRGSYKFVTNNCAVESYNLLKGALERSELDQYHSVSPKGVLEDLDRLEFVSLKNGDQEVFKARSLQLMIAYQLAYGYKLKSEKKDKEQLLSFIQESSSTNRRSQFLKFTTSQTVTENLHDELVTLKKRLVVASSFSVMEQQILRSRAAVFRKKAAEYLMNNKDEKIQQIERKAQSAMTLNFEKLAVNGYGVPLQEEMQSRTEAEEKMSSSLEIMTEIENVVKEKLPDEVAALELIKENIESMNQHSLVLRKTYRTKLELYILQVIKNLSLGENGRELLMKALNSKTDLDKVRELLDSSLVSEKEILDIKLRKIITELITV